MNQLNFSERGCIIMLTYHFSGELPGCKGYSSDYTTWPSYLENVTPTKLVQDWKEHTTDGYGTLYAAVKAKGNTCVPPASMGIQYSDDMQIIKDRIDERLATGSWNCVFAADQAAFDAEWASMKSDLEGMGLNDVVAEWTSQYLAGCEAIAPYLG